jgi:hypothetical protein
MGTVDSGQGIRKTLAGELYRINAGAVGDLRLELKKGGSGVRQAEEGKPV